MLKKTSTALKKCIVFFVDFSSIFRRKLMKNRVQSIKNSLARKNQQKSTFVTPFFSKQAISNRFLGSLWVLGGLPGRPGGHPFFHRSSVGCEDLAPGGSRSHTTSILSHMASILSHMASILSHMFSILSHIISILSPMGGIASMLC